MKNVSKNNDPQINKGIRLEKRRLALKFLKENETREKPRTQKEIADLIDASVGFVNKISKKLACNTEITESDLEEAKRGAKPNKFSIIPENVYEELKIATTRYLPSDYELDYSSWSAKAIKEYLFKIHKIDVRLKYIYNFLHNVGFSSKNARRVNPKRDDTEVENFISTLYALILFAMSTQYIVIFADEAHITKSHHHRGYAPIGSRANMEYATESGHSPYSSLTFLGYNGFARIFTVDGHMNSDKFVECLKILKKENPNSKFILILDNHAIHKSHKTLQWLNHHKGGKKSFIVYYLPKYAPDLNPVEYFNNYYKAILKRKSDLTPNELKNSAEQIFAKFHSNDQKYRDLTRSFFTAKECKFIANTFEQVQHDYDEAMNS